MVVGPRPWSQRPLARLLTRAGVTLAAAVATISGALHVERLGVAAAALVTSMTAPASPPAAVPTFLKPSLPLLPGEARLLEDMQRTLLPPSPSAVAPPVAPRTALDALLDGPLELATLPGALLDAHEPFLALASTVEGLENRAYVDPGGLNVGFGYCITKRTEIYGIARVVRDLRDSGFQEGDITTLTLERPTTAQRVQQTAVPVSAAQALRLLNLVRSDYESIARGAVGETAFDALPAHRRAALTWLAYNTGDGFSQFRQLIAAVQTGQHHEAVRHLTPSYSDRGSNVVNARAGTLLMAAYWSDSGLTTAVQRSGFLVEQAQRGLSPIQVVDPKAVWPRTVLPPSSPYTAVTVERILAARTNLADWRRMQQRAPPTAAQARAEKRMTPDSNPLLDAWQQANPGKTLPETPGRKQRLR